MLLYLCHGSHVLRDSQVERNELGDQIRLDETRCTEKQMKGQARTLDCTPLHFQTPSNCILYVSLSPGKKGVWAYVEGGMGAITQALAASAHESGATIATDCVVEEIVHDGHRATGVKVALDSGTETILASTVLANCNPHHTFTELLKGKA